MNYINCIRCRCAVLLVNMPRHLAESHGIDIVKGDRRMSADHRRCSICGTGTPAGVLCVDHTALLVLAEAVKRGTRSDWSLPANTGLVIPSHSEFQTSKHWTTPPGWGWVTQIEELMRYLSPTLDDSGQE